MSDDWELSKENVAPIKSGRSVKGLGGVGGLANKPVLGKNLGANDEERKYEQAIEEAKGKLKNGDDTLSPAFEEMILQAYIRYYKWVRETYKTSNDKSKAVLERATSEFKDSPHLKNNEIYVKLWIELADMMRTPSEIFGFMQTNKIGEKVALFWVAWAFVAEKAEKYDVTEQIFRKGIKKLAEPKELIENRFRQFQRRMVSRIRNGEILEPNKKREQSDDGGRKALSSLSRSKTSKNSSQRTGVALSGLSGGLAKDMNARRANHENRNGGRGASAGAGANRRSSALGTSNSSGAAPMVTSSGNFTIFMEGDVAAPSGEAEPAADSDLTTPNEGDCQDSHWKSLGQENKRTKENHVPVSTWSEAPLGAGAADTVPSAIGFSIFADGGDDQQENEASHIAAVDASTDVKPELEEPAENAGDAPGEPAPEACTSMHNPTVSSMSLEESILANLSAMDDEDGTINTRLAMGTIDAMFCDSPQTQTQTRQEVSAPKAAGPSFTVFTDD